MKLIYNAGFTSDEIGMYRNLILINIVECAKNLADAMEKLKIPYGFNAVEYHDDDHPRRKSVPIGRVNTSATARRKSHLDTKDKANNIPLNDQEITQISIKESFSDLKQDEEEGKRLAKPYSKAEDVSRNLFCEIETTGAGQAGPAVEAAKIVKEFQVYNADLSNEKTLPKELVEAILTIWEDSGTSYFPTNEDILHIRTMTTAIYETKLKTPDGLALSIYDLGGQRSERKKWAQFFDNAQAIIFVCALSAYDQVCSEDISTNRIIEAMNVFSSICNHPLFKHIDLIVFMNKIDLFREKLEKTPISLYFPSYQGPNTFDNSAQYFIDRLIALNKYPEGKCIYPHLTWATDTSTMKKVLHSINDSLAKSNFQSLGDLAKKERERNALLFEAKTRPLVPQPVPLQPFQFCQLPRQPLVNFGIPANVNKQSKVEREAVPVAEISDDTGDGEKTSDRRSRTDVVPVPIKIDFDFDLHGFKIHDQFLWNLNETEITPEIYAQQLCGDFRLPHVAVTEIAKSIKEQIDEFYDHSFLRPPIPAQGVLPPLLPLPPIDSLSNREEPTNSMPPEETAYIDSHSNLRVVLKIDVNIGNITVIDNVEWDINCVRNSPELFAASMCTELGLPTEFKVAITVQLYEQIQMYQKSLFVLEHPFDDSEIADEDLWYNHFLPPVTEVLRSSDQIAESGPTIITGVQPPPVTVAPAIEEKSGAARRRRLFAARVRGRNSLPDREVSRLWMTPLPVWKNGVKKPPVPRPPPAQQIAAAAVVGKRRTRQDAQLEEEEAAWRENSSAATTDGGGSVESLGASKQKKLVEWKCANCVVGIREAGLVRDGPSGLRTLCDECGLFSAKNNGAMRQVKKEETESKKSIEKPWFRYPQAIE
ncbi:hypothetical protein HK100_004718 [Physocladia obscura]|uniref:GATA-type domain-containing protein n=1 Tax=Physocladia obscura TaxID=109957 RepID=A0AAD5XCT5_9FUNG|nr:hypothetical protein HK100_004718 [Physocladia obscura]